MSLKSLLRIAEDYLRKHPSPTSAEIFKGMMKLTYTFTAPATNSKSKRQMFHFLSTMDQSATLETSTPVLSYDEKANRLQFSNNFDSISTEEAHDKVMQDAIFGTARLNKNKDRWIYAAKKKTPKSKSYFLGGSGKSVYAPDLGELYDDISQVQIFIWDLKLKKIFPIDIQVEGDESKYVYSYPIFANDEGTKFICHGYQRTQFGHGISFCFNRPVHVFEVSTGRLGEQNQKTTCKRLISKHETNMFANISPCYNYVLYFGGADFIHSYYLDLVILKRVTATESEKAEEEEGYNREWKQIHRIKDAFIGSYYTIRTQTFNHEGQPYAYFQTIDKAEERIKVINLESGEIKPVSKNKLGESYGISCFNQSLGVVTGTLTTHAYNTFFYMRAGENKITPIAPLAREEFVLEQFQDPIHGYYMDTQDVDVEFEKKEKKPMVVIVHGGPHANADPCLTMLKYMLLKCGYAILMPNYSGSAGFGQEYMKAAVGNIGTKDAEEIIKLIDNVLSNKPHIDKAKVYVYGGSYGGYMAAIMGTRYSQHFKAAVILNGVLSVPANFWFSDIPEWSTAQTLGDSKIHKLTADDYVKMFQQSPLTQPMKIPTLQFLGAKDRRVPYRQGLLFDAMTKKAGTSIQTFVYENAAHSLADSVDTSVDVVIKSMQFLQGIPFVQVKAEEGKASKAEGEKENQKGKQQKVIAQDELKEIDKQI